MYGEFHVKRRAQAYFHSNQHVVFGPVLAQKTLQGVGWSGLGFSDALPYETLVNSC